MDAIQTYAAQANAYMATISTALDDIKTEIATLNAQVTALQTSAGTVTPEDQATIDSMQATLKTLTDKSAALDTINPPAPPPAQPAA